MRLKFLLLCLLLSACSGGRGMRLDGVTWRDVPGWEEDRFHEALSAILRTCDRAPEDMIRFCQKLNNHVHDDDNELRKFFEQNLKPYRVVFHGSYQGKITGYYEAELTGSRERENGAQVPIYGLPENYEPGRKTDTREVIEKQCANAPIIAWADDPVELFIAQVQGSGRLTTADGEIIHLGYAGNNGYPFKGIGTILKEAGVQGVNSMPQIRQWLQDNPVEAQQYMRKNKRYIYFREIMGETPYGTAEVVLTPERSVAVDTTYVPLHTLMFLDTTKSDKTPIRKMVVAQDTGSAIKGAIRADYFFGHGEKAFQEAGQMNQIGSYYILLPKD